MLHLVDGNYDLLFVVNRFLGLSILHIYVKTAHVGSLFFHLYMILIYTIHLLKRIEIIKISFKIISEHINIFSNNVKAAMA